MPASTALPHWARLACSGSDRQSLPVPCTNPITSPATGQRTAIEISIAAR